MTDSHALFGDPSPGRQRDQSARPKTEMTRLNRVTNDVQEIAEHCRIAEEIFKRLLVSISTFHPEICERFKRVP